MAAPTAVRLPEELDERLEAYCAAAGAVKNRVVVLALLSWLDDDAPALPVQPPDDETVHDDRLG